MVSICTSRAYDSTTRDIFKSNGVGERKWFRPWSMSLMASSLLSRKLWRSILRLLLEIVAPLRKMYSQSLYIDCVVYYWRKWLTNRRDNLTRTSLDPRIQFPRDPSPKRRSSEDKSPSPATDDAQDADIRRHELSLLLLTRPKFQYHQFWWWIIFVVYRGGDQCPNDDVRDQE